MNVLIISVAFSISLNIYLISKIVKIHKDKKKNISTLINLTGGMIGHNGQIDFDATSIKGRYLNKNEFDHITFMDGNKHAIIGKNKDEDTVLIYIKKSNDGQHHTGVSLYFNKDGVLYKMCRRCPTETGTIEVEIPMLNKGLSIDNLDEFYTNDIITNKA